MTLGELIAAFRVAAQDKAEPYLWADNDVTRWLNEAVEEAVIRGRLLYECSNPKLCHINVKPNVTAYKLHPAWFEIDKATLVDAFGQEYQMSILSPECAKEQYSDVYALILNEQSILIAPTPEKEYLLTLSGYRLPLVPLVKTDDEPELHQASHKHLLDWVLFRAFSTVDSEMYDVHKAVMSEARFSRYFGLQTDSDMRRITREDLPQNVIPYWV